MAGLLRVRFGRVGLRSMSAGLHSEADARPHHAVQLPCWRPIGPDVQCRKGQRRIRRREIGEIRLPACIQSPALLRVALARNASTCSGSLASSLRLRLIRPRPSLGPKLYLCTIRRDVFRVVPSSGTSWTPRQKKEVERVHEIQAVAERREHAFKYVARIGKFADLYGPSSMAHRQCSDAAPGPKEDVCGPRHETGSKPTGSSLNRPQAAPPAYCG